MIVYAVKINDNPKLCYYGGERYSGPVFLYSANLYPELERANEVADTLGGMVVRIRMTLTLEAVS